MGAKRSQPLLNQRMLYYDVETFSLGLTRTVSAGTDHVRLRES